MNQETTGTSSVTDSSAWQASQRERKLCRSSPACSIRQCAARKLPTNGLDSRVRISRVAYNWVYVCFCRGQSKSYPILAGRSAGFVAILIAELKPFLPVSSVFGNFPAISRIPPLPCGQAECHWNCLIDTAPSVQNSGISPG